MAQFMGGGAVDCGPSTALKDVSSLVERDYGVQRDRFASTSSGGSGSGSSAFRTRPGAQPQAQAGPAHQSPFDLNQLRSHLPGQTASPGPVAGGPIVGQAQQAQWAQGYGSAAPLSKGKGRAETSSWGGEFDSQRASPVTRVATGSPQAQAPFQNGPAPLAPWQRTSAYAPQQMYQPQMSQTQYMPQQPMYHPPPAQFAAPPPPPQVITPLPTQLAARAPEVAQNLEQAADKQRPDDDLARTAQGLVDQLGPELEGTKLGDSQFVKLLRGLGDGSVVVKEGDNTARQGTEAGEGATFVSSTSGGDWATDFLHSEPTLAGLPPLAQSTSRSSMTFENAPPPQQVWGDQFQSALSMDDGMTQQRRKSVHFDETGGVPRNLDEAMASATTVPGQGAQWEDPLQDDLDDEFDTEALQHFNGLHNPVPQTAMNLSNAQQGSWGELQNDWDQGFAHIVQPEPYLFHNANPYTLGAPIVRELSPTTMGVLELEAAVQQDPRDAAAWLALGLKQQENEREDAAIRALAQAVQLAPKTRAAYLALAVSYTNEGNDAQAHEALERWIELGDGAGAVSEAPGETAEERQARIVERLIAIARQRPDDLDVDVQVALGVLFNSSEDYQKAEDCFLAALEARPDDWVLYNRLGATLANSGRSHEAIKYYHRALSLHPNFVRAQFNLGISYINLAQYRLAAQCILDAIRLQHADVTEGYAADTAGSNAKGVTSDALWTTLRMACLHLQRPELVALANHHDLSGFPLEL